MNPSPILRIISGGQTGADQGGLRAGAALGLDTGGWIPFGFRTDTGAAAALAQQYGLKETLSRGYASRTHFNIRDSNGTVIFGRISTPGSRLTMRLCGELRRPWTYIPWPPASPRAHFWRYNYPRFKQWTIDHKITTLNVAGNRESINPGIEQFVYEFLFTALKEP